MIASRCDILIKGRNRSLLFEKLSKGKIDILNIKNIDEKNIIITVNRKDCQKVFAILGDMWYNKLIKSVGLHTFFSLLKKRVVLFIGVAVFIACAYLFDNYIFSIQVNGCLRVSDSEIFAELNNAGAKKFAKFSDVDYGEIGKLVLEMSDEFSFVTVRKSGNRLIIDIIESDKPQTVIDYSQKNVMSTVCGVIKQLNVYHGMAMKAVGDRVEVGDVIASGQYIVGEKVFDTYALCYAVVECGFTYEYASIEESDAEMNLAINRAKFACPNIDEGGISDINVEKNNVPSGVIYKVVLKYLVEIGG